MTKQFYEIRRVDIEDPDGNNTVFYEIWDVFEVDGELRDHRNDDISFNTKKDAQAWIDKQTE